MGGRAHCGVVKADVPALRGNEDSSLSHATLQGSHKPVWFGVTGNAIALIADSVVPTKLLVILLKLCFRKAGSLCQRLHDR